MIAPRHTAYSLLLGLCLTLLLSACSCERSQGTQKDVARNQVLAEVGPNIITKAQFQRALQQLSPFTRRQYITHKRKAEFLEQLIQFELLVQEAKKRGFHKDAAVLRIKHKAMIGLLIKQVVQATKVNTISNESLRKFYHQHYSDYNKPERRRAQHILFRMSPKADAAAWTLKEQALRTNWLPKIQQANATPGGFAGLARKHSEDPVTRINGGDLGYAARTQKGGTWAKGISDAVFAMTQVGQLKGPVRSPAGFHFLRLAEIVKPMRQPFHKLQHILRHRLRKERQQKAYRSFLAGLRRKYSVKIDQKLLLQVQPNPPKPRKATKKPKRIQPTRPTPTRPTAPARPTPPARPAAPTSQPTKAPRPTPPSTRPGSPKPTAAPPAATRPVARPTTRRAPALRRTARAPTPRRLAPGSPRPASRPASRPVIRPAKR